MIETYQCSLCGGKDWQHNQYIDKGNTVVQCMRCTHIQRWPLPIQEELNADFAAETQRKTRLPAMTREEKRRHVQADTNRRIENAITILRRDGSPTALNKRVIDVGAGEGFFAKKLRPYVMTVDAVEYESSLCLYESYDLVTAHHVLEHVRDPLQLLQFWWASAKQHCAMIVEVPNVQDMMIRLCTAYRDWHFQPSHLHYFSVQTLLSVLQRLEGNPRVEIRGIQRYSHMHQVHWMEHGTPWEMPIPLYPAKSEASEYRKDLEATFACDTLYAVATK